MRLNLIPVVAAAVLAGCAMAPPAQQRPPQPNVQNVIVPTLSGQRAVRNFIDVVETVEPVAEAACRARAPRLNCDFQIVVDDTKGAPPNAFQTRDKSGRPIIAFTVPLIALVANTDELAFIMAHEAAHHIRGHLDRQNQTAVAGARIFGGLASVLSGGSEEAVRASAQIGASIGARTYSKNFELEADALGTVIAAQAGYDPVRGARFFLRIADPGDKFLGTHPANADRMATVQRVAAGL